MSPSQKPRSLVTGTGERLVYNMLIMKPDRFWLENIEAHTRPSVETGLAPTNWRENKANANFIMRKGLMSWKSRRKRLPVTALRTPFLSFIAKPATVLIVTYRDNINDLWEKADWTQTHWQAPHNVLWSSREARRPPKLSKYSRYQGNVCISAVPELSL